MLLQSVYQGALCKEKQEYLNFLVTCDVKQSNCAQFKADTTNKYILVNKSIRIAHYKKAPKRLRGTATSDKEIESDCAKFKAEP